ncbi:hypothetical protein [Sphingomonas sp. IW22]|uniref:hypothetical protein n=1 Tax=Sphingomonas sp. IW22 TaxID=3242489 RepID=UPI0035227492
MRHVLTRQQIYDMIWERAVSKVAPEPGISDVALRKQCVKHAIPLPDATYWGRLHAGRPIKRKPLGVAPKGAGNRIVIDARAKPPAPAPIEAAIAVARQPVEAVAVHAVGWFVVARSARWRGRSTPPGLYRRHCGKASSGHARGLAYWSSLSSYGWRMPDAGQTLPVRVDVGPCSR